VGTMQNQQLAELSDFVASSMGLLFLPERWSVLERHVNMAVTDFGFDHVDSFLKWLLSPSRTKDEIARFASFLTISETYFWREPNVFEVFRDKIIPEIIQTRKDSGRRIRIWSAGCATGEEPYSIAIALRQALHPLKDWQITLLATDINPDNLKKAMRGVYREWSFRNISPEFKKMYFRSVAKGKYKILPEIRKMVTFAHLNLIEDIFPSFDNNTAGMDIIFCRNVLMYFSPSASRMVAERFYNTLVEGGMLMVAAAELSQQAFSQFTAINYPGAIVYQRTSKKHQQKNKLHINKRNISTTKAHLLPTPAPSASQPAQKKHTPPPEPAVVSPEIRLPNAATEETISEEINGIRTLADKGDLDKAWAACETAIRAHKLNVSLYYLGATILIEQNRTEEAVKWLKRALYLEPDFLLAHFALGSVALRQDNIAISQKHFKNALAILNNHHPDDILSEADGLTVERLSEIIRAKLEIGNKK